MLTLKPSVNMHRLTTEPRGGLTGNAAVLVSLLILCFGSGVANAQVAPVITGQGPLTTAEETALTITLSDITVSDPDVPSYPTGFTLTVQAGNDYTVSGNTITPILDFNGDLSVPVTVNDGTFDSAPFSLAVSVTAVNDQPTVVAPIANQGATEDQPFNLDISGSFADVDDATLSFSAIGLPATLSPIDPVTGIIGGTPTQADAELNGGVYNVTVTATDSSNASVNDSFVLTIGAENDPPTVATPIGPRSATEDEPFSLNVSTNFTDVDDPTLSFSAIGLPTSLSPIDPVTGIIAGTPTQADAELNGGVYNVTVTATDSSNASVSDSFELTILPVNDAPVADDQSVATDEDVFVPITLTGSDVDNTDLVFAIAIGPANGIISGAAPDLVYTPNPDFNGIDDFTFTVSDGLLVSISGTVSISIDPINDPPIVVLPIEDPPTAVEGTAFNFDISANFSDVELDTLTFAIGPDELPASGNISFDPNTGIFSGTPTQADARDNEPYVINVTATDNQDGTIPATDQFELIISALDRANVSLGIGVTPDPAMLNDQLRWTFTVRNAAGLQPAANVELNGSIIGSGLTVTSNSGCTIGAPAGQVTNFNCLVGGLPPGGSTSVILDTATSEVGDVTAFAIAAGTLPVPIDPNIEDNSAQVAVGVAQSFSNGTVQILGTANVLSIAAGDLDGDLVNDIVVGTAAGQRIQIYLSGGFRDFAPSPIFLDDRGSHEALAIADFDGNGTMDLAVANGGGAADMVYSNGGAANFSPMATLRASFSNDVAVGDFSNDGLPDLVFAATGPNPVYHGDGNGGFPFIREVGDANSQAVAAGDLGGSGRDDVVFANVGSDSTVRDGARDILLDSLAIGDASSVTVGQFGGSPDLDLAFGRIPSGIGEVPSNPVLINSGAGTFDNVLSSLGAAPTLGIFAGDVNDENGMGLDDIVFINSSGVHQIWVANGSGFDLHSEQIADRGSSAGVLTELGMTDIGDPGGVDLAMGGAIQSGAGVFLNDGFGNLGKGDAVAPILTLRGDASVSVSAGSPYSDAGASAQDNIDGDISSRIATGNTVNTRIVGAYSVTYNVSDVAGNAATPITRTVNVTPDTKKGGGGSLSVFFVSLLLTILMAVTHGRARQRKSRVRLLVSPRKDS